MATSHPIQPFTLILTYEYRMRTSNCCKPNNSHCYTFFLLDAFISSII